MNIDIGEKDGLVEHLVFLGPSVKAFPSERGVTVRRRSGLVTSTYELRMHISISSGGRPAQFGDKHRETGGDTHGSHPDPRRLA